MSKVDATLLLFAGVGLVILGSLGTAVNLLGQLGMIGIGACLLFVAAAMFAGVAVFEHAMGNALKFLDWLQGWFRR